MQNIAVLGTGTWGTALLRLLANKGHAVTAWSALPEEVEALSAARRHPKLPGMTIPDSVIFTADIAAACRERDMLVFAVPSPYVRATARAAAPFVAEDQLIVDVAKGMEAETLMTLTEVIVEEMRGADKVPRLVALSGPTHAEEVARDLPTTIVSASPDARAAAQVQSAFMTDCLRRYTNADIRGVEVAGALKNVIALAAGIAGGLGYGDNARAAIITRGIAEMARLGAAMGWLQRDLQRSHRPWRSGGHLHEHAQPQQPLRHAHRSGQGRGRGRARGGHGGRGPQRPARGPGTGQGSTAWSCPSSRAYTASSIWAFPPREMVAELMRREPKAGKLDIGKARVKRALQRWVRGRMTPLRIMAQP